MIFETIKNNKWYKKYELAKVYYEHYGNLEIPQKFKTVNGYEEDENGIALGNWINNQRQVYHGKSGCRMTEEQVKLLEDIGMRFETKNNEDEWYKKYELAKIYYEHYGNLEITARFKTVNGYEEDENGIALGSWISTQRQAYYGKGGCRITEEQVKLLENIGIRFETKNNEDEWYKKYELAKIYYEYYGNLEISQKFKTVNGYEEDENGIALGTWISTQRQAYYGKGERMITEERVKLLEDIGMKWYIFDKKDDNYQEEIIINGNTNRKQIEILNRVRSFLNKYSGDSLPTKEEINYGILNELNRTPKRKIR